MFFSVSELFGKIDPTKIRVTGGDVPEGDWIFNGQSMVFSPKQSDKKHDSTEHAKMIVQLKDNLRIIPIKAQEFGPLRKMVSDMAPLGGAVAGATIGSFVGVMGGFAAGNVIARNNATFHCELQDGRRFDAIADYKIFRRLQDIALK